MILVPGISRTFPITYVIVKHVTQQIRALATEYPKPTSPYHPWIHNQNIRCTSNLSLQMVIQLFQYDQRLVVNTFFLRLVLGFVFIPTLTKLACCRIRVPLCASVTNTTYSDPGGKQRAGAISLKFVHKASYLMLTVR